MTISYYKTNIRERNKISLFDKYLITTKYFREHTNLVYAPCNTIKILFYNFILNVA